MVCSFVMKQLVAILLLGAQRCLSRDAPPIVDGHEATVTYAPDFCEDNDVNSVCWDFIVVGAGAAGPIVARRLAEENRKWNVLLIDAGGDPPAYLEIPINAKSEESDKQWNYYAEPSEHVCLGWEGGRCDMNKAKMLGGCTSINGMVYNRGSPSDYDYWASLGNDGWDYSSILKYYKKFENFIAYPITEKATNSSVSSKYHAKGGRVSVNVFEDDPATEPARRALFGAAHDIGLIHNIDTNGEYATGYGNVESTVTEEFLRDGTARAYLVDVPQGLKVCKYSLVDKVIIRDNTAEAIVMTRNGIKYTVQAEKEIILSAGVFGSAAILERSGIGNPKILKGLNIDVIAALPGVGENYMDQYETACNYYKVDYEPEGYFNALSLSTTNANLYVSSSGNRKAADYYIYGLTSPKLVPGQQHPILRSIPFNKSIADKLQKYGEERAFIGISATCLLPKSVGSSHIVSTDPEDHPKINADFLSNEYDIENTIAALKITEELVASPSFQKLNPEFATIPPCDQFEARSDDYYRCLIKVSSAPFYHGCCTNAMGPRCNPNTVVNSDLQVHGIDGLRVMDTSVMPRITRGNTMAPTMLIGEKGAAALISRWHPKPKKNCGCLKTRN